MGRRAKGIARQQMRPRLLALNKITDPKKLQPGTALKLPVKKN